MLSHVIDITNKKFGKLTVVSRDGCNKYKRAMWICVCECGNTKRIEGASLRSGNSRSCGCGKYPTKNIQGKKFFKLKAIKPVGRKNGYTLWECVCECGNTKIADVTSIIRGSVKSCGCIHKFETGVAMQNRHYQHYKASAANRRLPFNLSQGQFLNIVTKNCYYCGEEPKLLPKRKKDRSSYKANGIDRINPNKGYTPENSVACCKRCNWMKSDLSVTAFFSHLKKVLAYQGTISSLSETPSA